MTNHWNDIKNSDCILIMGSNAAENHPISFKWALKAQQKGGKIIHVDPRYTRTSARSDMHMALRSGTDISILGGMINYILETKSYFHEYMRDYTNASFIVGEDFAFDDGLFSGYDPETNSYDKSKWAFEMDKDGIPKRDMGMTHPRCVLNIMKQHYKRYTLDKISGISGVAVEDLKALYKTYAATGKRDKAGTIMYAMGWTQHSVGVQNIRAMAIIQLMLGNIGIAGGGVNALRGECNVQGSTDYALLYHILPGYIKTPLAGQDTLEAYNKAYTPVSQDPKSANWWQNYPKYSASLIKAMYSDNTPEEGYQFLPRLDNHKASEYSWIPLIDRMYNEKFTGGLIWGMNPACSGPDSVKTRDALGKLDWMVNVNLFQCETSDFWKGPGMDPKKIKTETFYIPCASAIEKDGSVSNSGRWMQWRYKGPEAPDGVLTDGHYFHELWEELVHLYEKEGGAYPDPITRLSFNNMCEKDETGKFHFSAQQTAKLANGWFTKDVTVKGKNFKKGQQVPSFSYLQADGSTTSGNWLYCNSVTDEGNKAERHDSSQTPEQERIGLFPNWTWCWPVNRRIIYNRASVDMNGQPWNPEKSVIRWDGKKWQGDVPDGGWAPGTRHPFIMRKHGFGQLFGPGRADGPLPEHYEPLECPVIAHPFSSQLSNPTAVQIAKEEKAVCDPRFPFVGTTYRVTEHWQTGSMTRWQSWLVEAEPQMFVEISPELAKLRGIENGEKVTVESVRGSLWAIAMVTERIKPFIIDGVTVHMVGMPWHYGWVTPVDGGDSANIVTPNVGDPNTGIPEYKAFMVNVRKRKEGDN
jgi:formate dehydrogenase major subunit